LKKTVSSKSWRPVAVRRVERLRVPTMKYRFIGRFINSASFSTVLKKIAFSIGEIARVCYARVCIKRG